MNEAVRLRNAYVLAGKRTPIGAFQGALSSMTAPQLGGHAIRATLEAAGVSPDRVDEVLFGEVLTAGVGQAPARQAAFAAGIPDEVPATTINKVCGSGMKTVMMAAQAVRLGDAELVVAGGMESMSNSPHLLPHSRTGIRMGEGKLVDSMIHDGLWDPYHGCHMGTCGDGTAAELGFSREELDQFAAESVRRAREAQAAGRFAEEIAPVEVVHAKGEPTVVSEDEGIAKAMPEKLPKLRPAFGKEGVTTAGNASSINDGACALLVGSEEHGEPLARIVAYAQHAQRPDRFTTAPAYAIEKLLAKAGLTVDDVDLFEVNEAFAVVALGVARLAKVPLEKMNVNGGAVVLGHPIGASGARLVLTAAMELRRRGGRYAVATPCIGGGEATAVLLERV